MAFDLRYVPLNVKTYREAYNRLSGPICVSLLAIITGLLLLSYEVGWLSTTGAAGSKRHFSRAAVCISSQLGCWIRTYQQRLVWGRKRSCGASQDLLNKQANRPHDTCMQLHSKHTRE
jgi:hypothetical protein